MDSNAELLMISRQLTHERKVDLLTLTNMVYDAESSGKKALADEVIKEIFTHIQIQDLSCVNNFQRSKK